MQLEVSRHGFELEHQIVPLTLFEVVIFLVYITVDSNGTKSIILWPTAEVQERLGQKVQFKSMAGNLYLHRQTQPSLDIVGTPLYNIFGMFWANVDVRWIKSSSRKDKMALTYVDYLQKI